MRGSSQGLVLGVLACGYFILGVNALAVIGLGPGMQASLGVSPAAIAGLVTVYALTYAVVAPAVQVLAGHLSRPALMATGGAVMALGCLVAALAPGWELAVAARVLLAARGGLIGPTASAAAAALVLPEARGRALAAVFTGMTVATVLGVPLTGAAALVLPWQGVMGLIGVVSALFAALALRAVPVTRGERVPVAALLAVLGDAAALPALGMMVAQMAAQFALYALIGPWLLTAGVAVALLPLALFIFGAGGVLGNLLAGRLTDRFGADAVLGGALAALVALFTLAMLPQTPVTAFGFLAIWAVAGLLFQVPQQKRLIGIDPARSGLMLALNAAALYLGMSLGSAVAGLVHDRAGPTLLPLGGLAFALLSLGLFALSRRALRRRVTQG